MNLKEYIQGRVMTLNADQSFLDAARLMRDHDIGAVPVLEGGKLFGILTDRDIVLRCVAEELGFDEAIRDSVTTEVITCSINDSIDDAIKLMKNRQIRRVVVVDQDRERPVGVVSLGDVSQMNQQEAAKVIHKVSRAA